MSDPIISLTSEQFAADGDSFSIHIWSGSGPPQLHVHDADDEAWHVLEGSMTFRFEYNQIEVGPGSTVFVPAGTPHTYESENARYLIFLTPRLRAMISHLHTVKDPAELPRIYERYHTRLLEN